VVGALFLAPAAAADACTAMLRPVEEVVREAQLVLRAQAIEAPPNARVPGGGVVLRVLEVLRGAYERPFLTMPGELGEYRRDPTRLPPYREIDCVGREPGCGSCFARRYRVGAQYLLLLKDGTPYWAALSPTNEEISGPDDPWVAWVRARL
jgi:hypothetical protein